MHDPSQPTNPGPLPTPTPSASDVSTRDHSATPHDVIWSTILDAMSGAGAQAGSAAADWWAQDTVGAHATGDTTRTARRVLAGLDDGDPAVCDALPVCDLSGQWADTPGEAQVYTDAAPAGAPAWQALEATRRSEVIDAYRHGFDTAVHDQVARHCTTILDPTGADHVAQTPPDGEHQRFVTLVHTPGLRLPHGRLAVTSLQQMPTHNGVAFVADLALDGRFVGRIENEGNGGGTAYYGLNSSRFNWRDLHEFVAGCRHDNGEPVLEEWVLDALVDFTDRRSAPTALDLRLHIPYMSTHRLWLGHAGVKPSSEAMTSRGMTWSIGPRPEPVA